MDSRKACPAPAGRRKRRKKENGNGRLTDAAESVLLYLQLGGTEIDNKAMLNAACSQIPEKLGDMLFGQCPARIEFDQQHLFDDHVRDISAEHGPVFIINLKRDLLLDGNPFLS